MDELLADCARLLSAKRLFSLPKRWAHVQNVAKEAARVAAVIDPGDLLEALSPHEVGASRFGSTKLEAIRKGFADELNPAAFS